MVNDLLTRKSNENMSDTDVLDDQEEDLLPADTEQNQLISLLAKMNENMATMSDSLRELHDKRRHVVSADHGDHTAEPANKAAKTAENDPADLVLSAVKNLLGSEESGNTEGDLTIIAEIKDLQNLLILEKSSNLDLIATCKKLPNTGRNAKFPQTEILRKHVATLRKHNG